MFRLPREPSVRGIMYSSYALGVIAALVLYGGDFSIYSLYLIGLSFISFILQLTLFSHVNECIKISGYGKLITPLTLMLAPYIIATIFIDLRLIISLLALKSSLFTPTVILHRGYSNNSSIFSYLIGTTLITTVYLDPLLFMNILNPKPYFIWVILAAYFTSTSYYIESKLEFRDINPIHPFLSWIWIIPLTYFIHPTPFILVALVEPTLKHLMNIIRHRKVGRGPEIVRMGRMELRRGYLFIMLLVIGLLSDRFNIHINIFFD